MLLEPALMERVKRTNIVMIYLQQQAGFMSRCNLYTIDINWGRNCYSYGGFRHLARNCRNRKIMR